MKREAMVDNCLCLLAYVSKHRGEWQTFLGLERECGVPDSSMADIINDAREHGTASLLYAVASSNGYEYRLLNRVGAIIDVEARGPFPIRNYEASAILEYDAS